MSRIGSKPVEIPSGVKVNLSGRVLEIEGKLGKLSQALHELVKVEHKDNELVFTPANDSKQSRALWGTMRALANNMVKGVSTGFTRALDINGVGYRAQMQGKNLVLQLGYSHSVEFPIPVGIEVKVPTQTRIEISGADKQRVGAVAAKIRGFRGPEPYKGKGIKYEEEFIVRKEGKKK